jgi:hypothetical protein
MSQANKMKRRSTKKTIYSNVYSINSPSKSTTDNSISPIESYADLLMYRYTFTSRVTLVAAFVLCISLLLQPIAKAYAEESTVITGGQEIAVVIDSSYEGDSVGITDATETFEFDSESSESDIRETSAEISEESDEVIFDGSDAILNTIIASETADDSATTTPGQPVFESSQEATAVNDAFTSTSTPTSTSTSTSTPVEEVENPSESDPTVNEQSNGGSSNSGDENPSIANIDDGNVIVTTTESEQQELGEYVAATTSEDFEPTVQEVSVVNSDQAIAFNRNECTEVADGSYYCQKVSFEDIPDDALFAAPDSTGDMEIYVVQDGVETQLTNNLLEDASPYFDSRSDTLVWHRLINDRYQIISYDIDSGEETQLTDTSVNNMEPTKSGDYTVWQRWVENNWEIILFDGQVEIQLTDSQKHDIAPHIYGDMIIWNVRSSDGTQSLMTYEISTQNFNQISDTDGVSVVNPRMLVMYEAQYQNGDSVMKGFDLMTGEIVPLEHLPRELPANLPEPDSTGETRALPTNTTNEEEQEQQDPEPEGGTQPGPDPTIAATSTVSVTTVEVSPDLDLRLIDAPVATTTDLIVEQAAIPDVVIPAFVATTTIATASSTQDS